jgi:hypothetical protein
LKVLTAVSAFDAHYPHVDKPTWLAILDFVKKTKPEMFIFGGDNLDCAAISHHNKNKPMYRPQGQMRKDLDGFRREMLDPLEKALPRNAKKIWLTGNHEDWLAQLIEEQPELDGLLSIPDYLRLKERGWDVKPQGGHFKHGHLKFIHGDVLTGGQAAPGKALNTYVESIVHGHFHAFASATKILPHSAKYKWQAWGMGCVGRLDASYLKKRPTGWLTGFGVTEFYGSQGRFNHIPLTVFNGGFAYGGRYYGKGAK